jgi:flagellar protein FliT
MAPDDGRTPQGGIPRATRRLIEHYQEIARVSAEMLAAARSDRWEEVARLEAQCQREIVDLKRAAMVQSLSPSEQLRRVELLRSMLRDDAQIRRRAEPWLRELEQMIGIAPKLDEEGQ